jgi:hypothetical protein
VQHVVLLRQKIGLKAEQLGQPLRVLALYQTKPLELNVHLKTQFIASQIITE